MAKRDRLTRRCFLRTGLAASALPLVPMAPLAAQQGASAGGKKDRQVFLFVDWFHVKKGDLLVTLDPKRISPEGQKLLDQTARDFGKTFERGEHGFRPADVPFGVRITQEVAERSQPWLVADKPWERSVTRPTMLYDEGRYRCWYFARLQAEKTEITVDQERAMELRGSALAYAESEDGWNWTKPDLKVLPYKGSLKHNLLSSYCNGGSVFRDDHGPTAERYKCFHFDELPKEEVTKGAPAGKRYGLFGVTSADGYHWKLHDAPLIRYFSDTVNIGAWDPLLGKYVGFFRHHLSGRTISRSETEDFWNWPAPQPLLYAGPLDSPADDYYNNGYTHYPGDPSLRLLFAAIYHRERDSVDVRLAVSRDGRAFQWVSYQPIIELGRAGAWDGGSLYAQPDLVHLPDGRLALPYDAYNTTHNEVWFRNVYRDYPIKSAVAWALWQDGRLAGIQAESIGQFTTNAARFDGKRIEINARTTRAGSVEVELRVKGKALEGFSFADCVPFSGDEIWASCKWQGDGDLAGLRGKNLELAIRLRSAKVFAYRFVS